MQHRDSYIVPLSLSQQIYRRQVAKYAQHICCIEYTIQSISLFVTPMPFVCGLAEVCGPALTITLEWEETDSDLDLLVTEPDGSIVSFASMVGVSAHSNGARLRHVRLF